MMMKKIKLKGFTLIEILVVLMILGLLTAVIAINVLLVLIDHYRNVIAVNTLLQ